MASSPRLAGFPPKQGMYNPAFEKDACGLAMVATLRGEAGHDIIDLALTALRNLEHRGAIGSDAGTGDGAGILTQMPDSFLRAVVGFEPSPYVPGREWKPEGAVQSQDTDDFVDVSEPPTSEAIEAATSTVATK